MKVLNLQCGQQHVFEGWFGSEADFQDQRERALVSCPLCGDAAVVKLPTAPRLNLHANRQLHESPPTQPTAVSMEGSSPGKHASDLADVRTPEASSVAELQGAFIHALREVIRHTEDVGQRFPEQVRRMHHGDMEPRPIRGQATAEERAELREEGIEVMALPQLPGLNETLQ